MNKQIVKAAIQAAGGYKAVAKEFGISEQAVRLWEINGVSHKRVLRFSELSGCSVHELRPDLFGPGPNRHAA